MHTIRTQKPDDITNKTPRWSTADEMTGVYAVQWYKTMPYVYIHNNTRVDIRQQKT